MGVTEGMVVMAHVSLSAFGHVEGGAETVIEALVEGVGERGTLLMPAMSGEQPFDVHTSPSTVGTVTERFRSWPGVKRSVHPTHSVCGLGPATDELICAHIEQPTALGPESPWGRLARLPEGHVLLLGCDQDRNTLLHCAEEAVDAPYLNSIQRDYLDARGVRRTKTLEKYPGPHRDFIGLDRLFSDGGAMRVGKVGRAVCRLMHAGKTLELAVAALRADPAAVLCNNPNCEDCVRQRAAITRHRLAQEDFTLAVIVDELALPLDRLEQAVRFVREQGIEAVEFGPELTAALLDLSAERLGAVSGLLREMQVRVTLVSCPPGVGPEQVEGLAVALGATMVKLPPPTAPPGAEIGAAARRLEASGITLVVENAAGTLCDTKARCEAFLEQAPGVSLAFNPAHFAHAGEKPFLQTFYKGRLKRAVRQLYVTDGCRPGRDTYTLPGRGQGEVKELISILRCAGFDGVLCLKMGNRLGRGELLRQLRAFWYLMERM